MRKLKDVLGRALGRSEHAPEPGVIGSIEGTEAGNLAIRIGRWLRSGGWEQKEYVVLTSEERDELIGVLESHQGYRTVKCGDIVGVGSIVLAVQYANGAGGGERRIGTVLAWTDHKREYVVYTVDPYGEVSNGTYTFDEQRALNAYIARSNDHLFRHFNAKPPAITYAHVAERDVLKGDSA